MYTHKYGEKKKIIIQFSILTLFQEKAISSLDTHKDFRQGTVTRMLVF